MLVIIIRGLKYGHLVAWTNWSWKQASQHSQNYLISTDPVSVPFTDVDMVAILLQLFFLMSSTK
jgi:hypothetical protein